MNPSGHLRRALLLTLAVLLASLTMAYSILWMRAARWQPTGMIGFAEYTYHVRQKALEIDEVVPGGPADLAGLENGDRVLAIAGRPLTSVDVLYDEIANKPPATAVELTVERPGRAGTFNLQARLDAWPRRDRSLAQRVAGELMSSYPIFFFVVGFGVLFLRLVDRHAWLLALLFVSIMASGPLAEDLAGVPPSWRGFSLAFHFAFGSVGGCLFYWFLAVFPVRSPLERRAPWLKWVLLCVQLSLGLPLAVLAGIAGNSRPLYMLDDILANHLPWVSPVLTVIVVGSYGLGLVSLVLNMLRAPTVDVRRRTRVILWGLALGPMPFLLLQVIAMVRDASVYSFPFWLWAPCVLFILVMPASVTYAVMKHRVLDPPVLLRRSARYFLVQRGFMALLVVTGTVIIVFAASMLSRAIDPVMGASESMRVGVAVAAAAAGVLVVWGLGRVHRRIAPRIDRAFFRSAYDARQILEDLIDRSRSALSREELSGLLHRHLGEALHPASLQVYLRGSDALIPAVSSHTAPIAGKPPTIPLNAPLVSAMERQGRPGDTAEVAAADLSGTSLGMADCLVPVLGRTGRILGLIVLGRRRSEEPYTGEDRRLLAGIAGQAGLTLESFAQAEEIAQRIEAERRLAREMDIARQVQENLLPRRAPETRNLELAARCIQARAIGGDFYDYLPLGEGHLGLVLADISGKGISAALLMSSLQAMLRSRTVEIRHDPVAVLTEINQRLLESTEPGQFATLFLGDYDDGSGCLRYANCGHNPALLIHRDGACESLGATATVLGGFSRWGCSAAKVELSPRDLLVIYSDGVTEAGGEDGDLFGESRLAALVSACKDDPLADVVAAIMSAVGSHGTGPPEDDLTLLVARVRSSG
jgi:sigma-B regulation protein RsbU (phosphoserine phosphatase)